jgi:hypothetical protein
MGNCEIENSGAAVVYGTEPNWSTRIRSLHVEGKM